MTEMIAPPDYTDALQDAVVSQKGNTGLQGGGEQPEGETEEKKEELTEIPPDENEVTLFCIHVYMTYSLHLHCVYRLKTIVLHLIPELIHTRRSSFYCSQTHKLLVGSLYSSSVIWAILLLLCNVD